MVGDEGIHLVISPEQDPPSEIDPNL